MSEDSKKFIKIRGAREHNLKGLNVDIPKNKLVVFTGLSGSGKTSLAFDTIFAEGQRRYVESLSSYARQFLGIMKKPDVDLIEGLSPAISIDQKSSSHNPRSTVGTITEIYDYLRLLYARIGHPHCPKCNREISSLSVEEIAKKIFEMIDRKDNLVKKTGIRLLILSPVVRDKKGEFRELFENLKKKGFSKVRIDGNFFDLINDDFVLIKTNKHSIEAIVDRLVVKGKELKTVNETRTRLIEGIEQSLKLSDGLTIVSEVQDPSFSFPESPMKMIDHLFSERFACPSCNISLPEIEPRSFSFNSPHGACPNCSGLGFQLRIDKELIINSNLSVLEGGILPYARMLSYDTWFRRLMLSMAKRYNIDLNKPIGRLSDGKIDKILYGSVSYETFNVSGEDGFGRQREFETNYEGVIPNLERRYRETQSDYVRREIGKFMINELCPTCKGARLKPEVLGITICGKNIAEVSGVSSKILLEWIKSLDSSDILTKKEKAIASPILRELKIRVNFLVSVGLDYLTIDRPATTLSGGEAQRIRLASQIGTGLTGVLYILDEPTIGLHQKDNNRLIETLRNLRDLGNTVIVVEHDRETIESADFVFDFGPQAGDHGGEIVASGSVSQIKTNKKSLTGKYLSHKKKIQIQRSLNVYESDQKYLIINGCKHHNLKDLTVKFPVGKFICITGVSGSGKSTLIHDTLFYALRRELGQETKERPGEFKSISGIENFDRVLLIDQSPIGRTPRSNPATYTGAFDLVRELFSQAPEARMRGYNPGRFSFNVKGGRCEACFGEGQIKIEMQFLPDVYVDCDVCSGKRYNSEALEVLFRGKNIHDILQMSVEEALAFFGFMPPLQRKLSTLHEVGLSYIKLGQPAPTLSGGEAQRVKLARELCKTQSGRTIYILDEPTVGLHFADLEKLLLVLFKLVDKGNTVIIIEHHPDVIKNADFIIDLGPEGGESGGFIVSQGAPNDVANSRNSYTGKLLKSILKV